MALQNADIARIFDRIADLLEIEDANPFRVRAYRNAAQITRGESHSMADLLAEGNDLTKLPSIGKDLAEKIQTLVKTGKLPFLKQLERRTPGFLSDLMKLPGLGPKRVKILYKELHIRSVAGLRRAAASGRVEALPGFGSKVVEGITTHLDQLATLGQRTLLAEAEPVAIALVDYLEKIAGVKQVTVAGSFRRCKETVGDLDILVTAKQGTDIIKQFTQHPDVGEVLSQGSTRSTVILHSGLQVDLRVVPQVSYGAALHYFTGSKAHNIAIRKMAVKRGLKVNEYGVFKGEKRIAGKTEREIYKLFGLPYIEPELRQGRGELEAAKRGKLPKLVTLKDIKGDLHAHTKATDGHYSLEEMAKAAKKLGYQYLAITDHSQHLTVAHGLDPKRLKRQINQIDRLNEKLDGIVLLKSSEVDILEDGSLDLPDSILKQLDLTVCAIHHQFTLSRKKQTERILRAMDNPYFNIFAHPTSRLLNQRDPIDVDLEKVMKAAKEKHCVLEVNAQPVRLDLNGVYCKMAKEIGVKVAISTDSHSTDNLNHMRFGVAQARRGWLTAADVVNTRTLAGLKKILQR